MQEKAREEKTKNRTRHDKRGDRIEPRNREEMNENKARPDQTRQDKTRLDMTKTYQQGTACVDY
jgi:hypothetical protein